MECSVLPLDLPLQIQSIIQLKMTLEREERPFLLNFIQLKLNPETKNLLTDPQSAPARKHFAHSQRHPLPPWDLQARCIYKKHYF